VHRKSLKADLKLEKPSTKCPISHLSDMKHIEQVSTHSKFDSAISGVVVVQVACELGNGLQSMLSREKQTDVKATPQFLICSLDT
jgi:hypothetical protein